MALPGLSLPGLGSSATPNTQTSAFAAPQQTTVQAPARTENLQPQTEYRFEVPFSATYTIKLLFGHAEIFGSELAVGQPYTFSGCKGAVFTWQGCSLEMQGESESEYVGSETDYAIEWLNAHGMLESARDMALQEHGGPRILIVGSESVGKSSLVRSLAAWGVKLGRSPTVVNLDPREGLLTPPGSLTAVTVANTLDIEHVYGITPVSGPTAVPTKTPLVYSYPCATPTEKPELYKAITTRVALSVTNKLEEDTAAKRSGLILDTPGVLNDPKSNYNLLAHLVSEFSITLILTMGSERLFNDLNRKFSNPKAGEDAPSVLRIAKPGGAVERDTQFLKQSRIKQMRQYFFGTPAIPLNPHSHSVPFSDLAVYRTKKTAAEASAENDDEDDEYNPSLDPDAPSAPPGAASAAATPGVWFDRVTPSAAMTGGLLAIKFCPSNSEEDTVRDSAVMGFLYVSEIDEVKKRVRFLAPHPQRWGDRALVWGGWPEAVGDLVG